MSVQLSRGQLKGIRIPTVEQELKRLITRTREQLVKQKKKLGNQIKFKLLYFGLIDCEDTRVMSFKLLKEYESMVMPLEIKMSIAALAHLYRETAAKIRELEKQMEEQASKEEHIEKIYRCAPGIGPVCARVFANELGDMSQFKRERALFGFLGMTPTETSKCFAQERTPEAAKFFRPFLSYVLLKLPGNLTPPLPKFHLFLARF